MPLPRFALLVAWFAVSITSAAAQDAPAAPDAPAAQAPAKPKEIVAPPGIDKELVAPRTGAALERAKLPLSKIVAELDRPAYLPKAGADPDANPAQRADARIAELKAILEKKPDDRTAATELLRLYLIDKDDPAAALPYLEGSADPKLRIYLPLAAKPAADLKEGELMDLAIWYQDLGTRNPGDGGIKMLRRAARHYEAFLKAHPAQDLLNSTAKLALLKVQQALEARAGAPGRPRGPSLHVQRTYARARAAWREGQPHVAINLLEAANNLAPNQPGILRLLGEIYFNDLRNAVQGAHYVKQVLALEPNDLDSLFLLGRYEYLHLRRASAAIAVFVHALTIKDKDADPATRLLMHHYLGRALQNEGYDAASIEQFELFLAEAQRMHRPTRHMQEVGLFTRTLPVAWVQVGDSHNRLDNPKAAADAYAEALRLEPDEDGGIVRRIVYTRLRLGQGDEALKAVIDLIKQTEGERESVALLKYLIDSGANAGRLTGELKAIYEHLGRPAALALAVADMQGGEDGLKTLREHLLASPTDREVFEAVLNQLMATDKPRTVEAVLFTSQLIAKVPAAAERYSELLLAAAGEGPAAANALLKAIASLEAEQQAAPMVRLLKATALMHAGKDDEALEEYALAVAADPSLVAAQASLIKLLIDRGDHARAAKALATVKDPADPRMLPLRVRVLRETNKVSEAARLLDSLDPQQLRQPDLVLERAKIEIMRADIAGAIRILEEGLDANPTTEELYEALFDLLALHETPEAQRQVIRLTDRMLRRIPGSKVARVQKARLLISNNDVDAAERLLREVQRDDPQEVRSLVLLTQVLFFTGRKAEADELISARLKAFPRSQEIGAVTLQLVRMHIQSDNAARAIELATALLENRKAVEDPRPVVMLIRLAMIRSKKFDGVDAIFKKAIEVYPEHWADLMADWALTWEYGGEKAKSEKLLEEVLAKHPDHAKANNALGYSWADQGRNLKQCEKMIAIALKDEPDNSAYLDSMGWVKYKLGDFAEAVKYLEKATMQEHGDHAVIMDHLGDALFRAGRQIEALEWWQKARRSVDPAEFDLDPELKSVATRLQEKIRAVSNAADPPLADVPAQTPKKDEKDAPKDAPKQE